MQIHVSAINDIGEEVAATASSERDALAMALLWDAQGFREVTITNAAGSYTAEEYAAKILSSP